tara:strand:- start:1261 stop:2613 length:1353 start_codon:yes stop_codon:yes gene_type:complete
MPNFHSKVSGREAITPTSYDISSVRLFIGDKTNSIEIKDIIASITIKESIYSSSIEVDIRIIDGVNLFELSRIVGGEEVHLKLFRIIDPTIKFKDSKNKFDIKVNVASIVDHNKKDIGVQLYTLKCYSNHTFVSSLKKINRSFQGVPNALVTDICKKDLAFKDSTVFTNKNTNEIKGIYPNLKPLEAINWILRNCSGEDNTPLFFYETIQNGLQFNSYSELLDQESYMTYNDKAFNDAPSDKETYDAAATKIRRMSSPLDMSVYDMINSGVFSSNTQTVDIATKSYENTSFKFKGKSNLNGFKPFADIIEFDNTTLIDSTKSKEFFINVNSKAFGDVNNYHNPLKGLLGDKQSCVNALNFMTLNLLLNGDFNLVSGSLVNLKIIRTGDSNEIRNSEKAFSGKYLVTGVIHSFGEDEYVSNVILQKDSMLYNVSENPNINSVNDNKILTNG